jgi:hypothetical protein
MTTDFSQFQDGQTLTAALLNAALQAVDNVANAAAAAVAAAGARVGNGVTGIPLVRPPLADFTLVANGNAGASFGYPVGATSDAQADSLVLQCLATASGANLCYADMAVPAGKSVITAGYEYDHPYLYNLGAGIVLTDSLGGFHLCGYGGAFGVVNTQNEGVTDLPNPALTVGPYSSTAPLTPGPGPAALSSIWEPPGRGFFTIDSSGGFPATLIKFGSNGRPSEAMPIGGYAVSGPIVRVGIFIFPNLNTTASPPEISFLEGAGKLLITARLINLTFS